MDEVTAFLDHVIPRLRDEVVALENGDARPRKGLWSHHDPVTLVGAEASASGWQQVEPIFDRLAESFSQGQSCTYDVLGGVQWRSRIRGSHRTIRGWDTPLTAAILHAPGHDDLPSRTG